jgi:lipopolysaccharide/colanic/teichoic acid biosynthesis glycosyltransferase
MNPMHLDETWTGRVQAQALRLDDTGMFLRAVQSLDEAPAVSSLAKRALDFFLSLLLLGLLSPILGLAMLLVKLTSRGPALFVQPRIGHQGRQFSMVKLRTMRHGAERAEEELAAGQGGRTFLKIENDPRTTWIGRRLRKWSVDEIPQLMNVLRGDMSLVGPRPLLLCDFRKFPRREQLRRFSVKPGLTGLWQVSGRSDLPDSERMRLDLEYVDRWSLWLDLRILARTLPAVVSGRGAT